MKILIYIPYLYFGLLSIWMFALPPKEVWWALPLRIFGAITALVVAAVLVRYNRRKMR